MLAILTTVQLSSAMGNMKDPLLEELEMEAFACLVNIAFHAKDPNVAVGELFETDIVKKFDTLDPMHPAVTYFRPVDATPAISQIEDDEESNELGAEASGTAIEENEAQMDNQGLS